MSFEGWIAGILTLTACLVATLYLYLKHVYKFWKNHGIPYLEPSFPFGNAKDLTLVTRTFGDVIDDWYKQLKKYKVAGIFQLHRPVLMILDPELIKNVMVRDFAHFHDRSFFLDEENDPISAHLFFLKGLRWKNLRNKLSPTFTSGKLKMMFSTMLDCGNDLKDCLTGPAARKEELEIKDYMARYTTDIIASTAFGIKCNCLKNPDAEFRVWGRKIFDLSLKGTLFQTITFLFPSLASVFKIPNVEPSVAKFFTTVVSDTIDYRVDNNVKANDFMQLLIELRQKGVVDAGKTSSNSVGEKDAKGLTLNEVAAQAFVFYIAGFETSSTTLSFCLYEMALNPDIQKKLREEILSVTEQHGGEVTYESILKMGYLDKVISETLRKYPPLPFLGRRCTKEYPLPGFDFVMKEGEDIMIPVLGLHRDPKYFPNPEVFNPEHFSEEAISKRPGLVYLPFGDGPRICIGLRFGLMQTKVGLVKLLSHFEFHVSKKTPVSLVLDPKSFILTPVGGMWLKVTKVDT